MKVLFACGGTAGHINPGLSIAAALGSRCPDIQIRFAGNPDGMEARLVPGAGFEFVPFRAMGIQRRLTPYNIYRNAKSVCLLLTAQARAKKVIRAFGPDLVVGTGGYVSGPILLTAAKMGIPTATHEQNAFPGVTTKLLAKQVDKVLLAVEKAKEYLPKEAAGKCIVTGNPVRPEILTERREEARRKCGVPEGKLCILSFGGSRGAQRVNEAVADVMAWHIKEGKLHHIHATGQYGVELLPRLLQERKVPYSDNPCLDIREYIDDMPACLAAADLVICRAGASTISELAGLHPYPVPQCGGKPPVPQRHGAAKCRGGRCSPGKGAHGGGAGKAGEGTYPGPGPAAAAGGKRQKDCGSAGGGRDCGPAAGAGAKVTIPTART